MELSLCMVVWSLCHKSTSSLVGSDSVGLIVDKGLYLCSCASWITGGERSQPEFIVTGGISLHRPQQSIHDLPFTHLLTPERCLLTLYSTRLSHHEVYSVESVITNKE